MSKKNVSFKDVFPQKFGKWNIFSYELQLFHETIIQKFYSLGMKWTTRIVYFKWFQITTNKINAAMQKSEVQVRIVRVYSLYFASFRQQRQKLKSTFDMFQCCS